MMLAAWILMCMALDLAWVIGVKFLFVNVGGGTKTMGCCV